MTGDKPGGFLRIAEPGFIEPIIGRAIPFMYGGKPGVAIKLRPLLEMFFDPNISLGPVTKRGLRDAFYFLRAARGEQCRSV